MNGKRNGFKLGERLATIEGDQRVMHTKLDAIQSTVTALATGIGARVETHGERLAVVETEAKNNAVHTTWVSGKIDKYVKWGLVLLGMLVTAGYFIK